MKQKTISIKASILSSLLCVIYLASLIAGPVQQAAAQTPGGEPVLYLPLVLDRYPSKSIFGVSLSASINPAELNRVADTNAAWTRREFPWNAVEPNQGQRDWPTVAAIDQELADASRKGLKVILVLHYTPDWAKADPGSSCQGKVDPAKLGALGTFAYDLVQHYSKPEFNIHHIELWNEPDVDGFLGCWGNSADDYYGGRYYAEMLKAVYPRIKEADPTTQVLVGGLLLDCDPRTSQPDCSGRNGYKATSAKFMEGILLNDGGSFFDGVSFHAYDYYTGPGQYHNPNWFSSSSTTGPAALAKAGYLRELLNFYKFPNKFLVNTEAALLVCLDPNQPEAVCLTDDLNREQTKSSFLVQSYVNAIADGLRANIWYSALGERGSGLLNPDLTLRDSYGAFQQAQRELADAIFVGKTVVNGVLVYNFSRENKQIWVAWSQDGTQRTINLPQSPTKVVDMLNGRILPSSSLPVDWKPIYIEF